MDNVKARFVILYSRVILVGSTIMRVILARPWWYQKAPDQPVNGVLDSLILKCIERSTYQDPIYDNTAFHASSKW